MRDVEELASEGMEAASALMDLKELSEADNPPPPGPPPDRLPLRDITLRPELFQPRRGYDEQHVQELKRALAVHGVLDPVLLIRVGRSNVLVDGHHRIAAYEEARRKEPIPVRYFEGTLFEAVLEAGRANTKAKLVMTTQDRMDYAWRLTLLGYSKRQTKEAAGVSDGQIAVMRRVRKTLGDTAPGLRSWWEARKEAAGEDPKGIADAEEWVEAQAQHYADRLSKTFGNKLSTNPEVAARALSVHFGRRLGELLNELQAFAPDHERDDGDDGVGF